MPVTRSGNSYAMASTHNRNNPIPTNQNITHPSPTNQAPINPINPINQINPTLQDSSTSSHQNPNTEHPNTRNSDQPQLHYQLDQLATVMAQVMRRLDVMEERYAREEYGLPNQQGRRVEHRGRMNHAEEEDVHGAEEEFHEFDEHDRQVRRPRQVMHRGHVAYQPPLDELTKRMKVDVPDFLGKLEPNAFEDWLTDIEDLTEFKGNENNISTQPILADTPEPRIPATTAPRDEIASILDHQFVSTRRGGYYKFLVQWKNRPPSDSVWLQASEITRLHPQLLTEYSNRYLPESSSSGEPAIDANQEIEAEQEINANQEIPTVA